MNSMRAVISLSLSLPLNVGIMRLIALDDLGVRFQDGLADIVVLDHDRGHAFELHGPAVDALEARAGPRRAVDRVALRSRSADRRASCPVGPGSCAWCCSAASLSHFSYSPGGCTTSRVSMSECWLPQYSEQSSSYVPASLARNQVRE